VQRDVALYRDIPDVSSFITAGGWIGGAMRRQLALGVLVAVSLLGCDGPVGDYVAASTVSRGGFARNAEAMRAAEGREIRLWGYVDHATAHQIRKLSHSGSA
jgi:hypothetical protein